MRAGCARDLGRHRSRLRSDFGPGRPSAVELLLEVRGRGELRATAGGDLDRLTGSPGCRPRAPRAARSATLNLPKPAIATSRPAASSPATRRRRRRQSSWPARRPREDSQSLRPGPGSRARGASRAGRSCAAATRERSGLDLSEYLAVERCPGLRPAAASPRWAPAAWAGPLPQRCGSSFRRQGRRCRGAGSMRENAAMENGSWAQRM